MLVEVLVDVATRELEDFLDGYAVGEYERQRDNNAVAIAKEIGESLSCTTVSAPY